MRMHMLWLCACMCVCGNANSVMAGFHDHLNSTSGDMRKFFVAHSDRPLGVLTVFYTASEVALKGEELKRLCSREMLLPRCRRSHT